MVHFSFHHNVFCNFLEEYLEALLEGKTGTFGRVDTWRKSQGWDFGSLKGSEVAIVGIRRTPSKIDAGRSNGIGAENGTVGGAKWKVGASAAVDTGRKLDGLRAGTACTDQRQENSLKENDGCFMIYLTIFHIMNGNLQFSSYWLVIEKGLNPLLLTVKKRLFHRMEESLLLSLFPMTSQSTTAILTKTGSHLSPCAVFSISLYKTLTTCC